MAVTLGHESVGVIGTETDWGSEVACTNTGILVLPGTVITRNARPMHIAESSQPWTRQDVVIAAAKRFTGTIRQILRYDDLRLPAYFLGSNSNYATPEEQTAEQDDWLHDILMAADIEGKHFSLGLQHGDDIQTWISNKCQQVRIFNEPGDDLTMKLEASTLLFNEDWDSGTLVEASFADPTFPGDRENVVRFDQLNVKIGDHSDDAPLDGDDEIIVNAINLTMRRILAVEGDNVYGAFIREPVNAGQELDLVTLALTFPDFNVDARVKNYIADLYAIQHAMCDITFTGAQIGSGDNYSLRFIFPEMIVGDVGDTGNYGSQGRLPGTVTLHAVSACDELTAGGADPWDFEGLMRVRAINMQSTKAGA